MELTSTTSPNEHDIIQSRPEASYVNKSHVHRRSPSQRSQLVSDSEISVLDLGPSLNVSDAGVPVPVTSPGAGAGMIQKGAGSGSEIRVRRGHYYYYYYYYYYYSNIYNTLRGHY